MKCHDFERLWNERLDARGTPNNATEAAALEAHAATCPECRAPRMRYLLLEPGARRVRPVGPPAGFADRCLQALDRAVELPRPRARRAHPCSEPAAVAVGRRSVLAGGRTAGALGGQRPAATPVVAHPEPELLTDALADATSATWDLALEASAPAARIGRDVLGIRR